MSLLLLLSALLSALSGVGGGVRAPTTAQSVATSVAPRLAPAPTIRASARPVAGLPRLAAVARGQDDAAASPRSVPLWMSRRRE